jgi:hypothetical protein
MLCNDRTNSNPENTVGLLTMAGPGLVSCFICPLLKLIVLFDLG